MIVAEQNIVLHLKRIFATIASGIGSASYTPARDKTGPHG
jgi:hypothetical protein